MADIIQGMFGVSPSQLAQDRYNTGYAQDLKAVQLDPIEQANLMLRQGGRGLAQGVIAPMLGVQDVELQKAQMAQQLASKYDITNSDGLMQYAQALAQNGMPEFAQIAATKAQGMQKTGLEIKKIQQTTDREEQLRQAIAEMPEGLTPEEQNQYFLTQYRKFGSPDQQARSIEMQMRNDVGGMGALSPGQKARDSAFGKEYATYMDLGGNTVVEKNLKSLKDVIDTLKANPNLTGTKAKAQDATGTLSVLSPESQRIKDLAGGVVQGNLRQVLGGQFASKEGEQLLERAFNIGQPGADNISRLEDLYTQIEQAAKIKQAAGEYFDAKGTLKGFQMPKFNKSKQMPTGEKLQTYANTHFKGDVKKATEFLATQGYE